MPKDKREAGRALVKRIWGPKVAAELEKGWEELHPDLARFILEFVSAEVWSRPTLDLKTRSLCTLAAVTALGRLDQVRLHTRGALGNGATPEEIKEVLLHLCVYAGFPAGWAALRAAHEVLTELEAEGQRPRKKAK